MYEELFKIEDNEVRSIVSEEVQAALLLAAFDVDPLLVEASFIDAVSAKLKKTKDWTLGKIKTFLKSEIMQKIVQAIKIATTKLKQVFDPFITILEEMAKDFEKGFKKLIVFLGHRSDNYGLSDVFIPIGSGVKQESVEVNFDGDIFRFCEEIGVSPSFYFQMLGEVRVESLYREKHQINEVFAWVAFASHAFTSILNIITKIAHETGNPKIASVVDNFVAKFHPEKLAHQGIELIKNNGTEYVNTTLKEGNVPKHLNPQKVEVFATVVKTIIVATFIVITILGVFHGGFLGVAEAVVLVLSSPQSMKELGEGMKQVSLLKPIGHALEIAGEKLVHWLKSDTMATIHDAGGNQQPAAQPATT